MFRILILAIFFFSCKTEPIRQEIEVGKTIKIVPSNFPLSNDGFNFLWSSPSGPKNSNPVYKIDKNIMLFTPNQIGEYEITLTIESTNNTSLYEESFLYIAIESDEIISNTNIITKDLNDKKRQNPIDEKTNKYTIQVASWPTLEQARKDQINLRENGYDAYTEQYYIKRKDQLWWRVRVGNFSDKQIAIQIKNKLSKIKGNDLWIDYIE